MLLGVAARAGAEHAVAREDRSFDDPAFGDRVRDAAAAVDAAAPRPLRGWAVAATLARVRPAHVFGAVVSLLRERSVCVVAADSATAAAVAFGLANLLAPLAWQGALITTLPGDEVDLLGSPVPFIAGMTAATARRAEVAYAAAGDGATLRELSVLDVEAGAYVRGAGDDRLAPPRALVEALAGSFAPDADVVAMLGDDPGDGAAPIRAYVASLLEDLRTDWKTYGEENLETGDFEFVPEFFLEPVEARLALQRAMAHTQMVIGHVDALREAARK